MSLISPDSGLLIWMTLIFAIVFFVLAKFGFPIITGMVDKRSERINESIAKAKEAEQRLAHLADEQAALIEQARQEQGRILREATETREKILSQAREDARQEAVKILQNAKTQIEAERETAIRDIRRQVAMISVEVAEKVVRKDLSDDGEQTALLDRLVQEASGVHMS